MSEERFDESTSSITSFQYEERDRPAVCFVVEGDSNSVPAAILRARRYGHHVFVVPVADDGSEAVAFARQLDASVVNPDDREPGMPLRDYVTNVAQTIGFPGLIYHEVPSEEVDYERTNIQFHGNADYCVSPVLERSESKSVIAGIPAYNEETSIGSVVLGAKEHADEVVVVDDGSVDGTARVAEQAGATVIRHDQNRGKGAALQTLVEHVRTKEFDAFVLLDSDGQHAPADMPDVTEPVLAGDADLAIGSRYLEHSQGDETPRYRRFGQRALDVLTFGTSKTDVSDSQSGFRALSPEAVDRLSLKATSYAVESEMIDSIAREGLTITERPIQVRYEGLDGQTQNPLRHGLEVVAFILYLVRDRHPLLFFGLPGLIITVLGMAYGIDGILVYQSTGTFYPAKVFTSGFLTIIGVLGVFTGLILNRIANTVKEIENQQRPRRTEPSQ